VSRGAEDRARDVARWLAAARAVFAGRSALAASIASSTGLSPAGVELGFECLECDASPGDLRTLVDAAGCAEHVHVILSANVFVAPLRAIAIARAAAGRVTVRPSGRDPTLALALVAAAGDPAVTISDVRDPLHAGADRIDVYGRDATIAEVRARALGAGIEVRGHGAGLGVAFVRPVPGSGDAVAEALASDVVPFDQRGCLSPRIAFVEGPVAAAEGFARDLDLRLAAWASRVPRGALSPDERAEATRWRDSLAFAGRLFAGAEHAVGVAEPGSPLAVPPPGRHVLVVPVASASEACERMAPMVRYVVTVGSNDAAALAAVAPDHARRAPLGRMQRPPLDGPVDRRSV
jgi:hypothetical protein